MLLTNYNFYESKFQSIIQKYRNQNFKVNNVTFKYLNAHALRIFNVILVKVMCNYRLSFFSETADAIIIHIQPLSDFFRH